MPEQEDINNFGRRSFVTWTTGLKERIQKAEELQMRQYRGLTKDGKWVYGWYCQVEKYHLIIPNEAKLLNVDPDTSGFFGYAIAGYIEVIPETLGQFTGFLDKNKTDIYEGDIIKYPNAIYKMFRAVGWEGKENGFELIVWSEKNAGFMGKDLSRLKEGYQLEEISPRYLWVLEMTKHSEIIGNKWEHPELLE